MKLERLSHYIDGSYVPPSTGEYFMSDNPYTGEPWAEVARGNVADVELAVSAAHRSFRKGPWSRMSASERGLLLHRFGDCIAGAARELAELEVRDNGKLISEMLGQVTYLPKWFHYFGGLADKVQGDVIPLDKPGYFNFTRSEALGVVGIITPWNSPLMLLAWKMAPALAAGCTVVIKPSEYTSASTLALMALVEQAGFPPGVVNVVTGYGGEVGDALVRHPLVRKISFTGADGTGRLIAAQAGQDLKHVGLELGGKSPNIVFADAKLDDAVNGVVSGIFAATGQTCIAGSRLLIEDSIHDAFLERLLALAKTARIGDPMSPETQVGPVTTRAQYEKILSYIELAKSEGAQLMLGGGPVMHEGCPQGRFIEPTIFAEVENHMRIAQEEVFGPILSIIRFKTEDEAVEIANDVRFGLGAGIWTMDIGRAFRMAEKIESGTVWVNTYRAVSYLSPFGGYKMPVQKPWSARLKMFQQTSEQPSFRNAS